MTHHQIVMKLIGPITPMGESNTDAERYENLMVMCRLVDQIIMEIDEVAADKDSRFFSVKKAGIYAHNYLNQLSEQFRNS